MHGINYIVDDSGNKSAVVIDLKEWGKLWEDMNDIMVSMQREDEDTVSWDSLKEEMRLQ